jgi:hypothetical protein
VAALKHRAAKSKQSPRPIRVEFSAFSQRLHNQEPDPESAEIFNNLVCCSICSRVHHPDIFEVVLAEESVVPRLEVFERWLNQQEHGKGADDGEEKRVGTENALLSTILDMYRDEYAWTCLYYTLGDVEEEGREWDARQSFWDARVGVSGIEALLLGDHKIRWDLPP